MYVNYNSEDYSVSHVEADDNLIGQIVKMLRDNSEVVSCKKCGELGYHLGQFYLVSKEYFKGLDYMSDLAISDVMESAYMEVMDDISDDVEL